VDPVGDHQARVAAFVQFLRTLGKKPVRIDAVSVIDQKGVVAVGSEESGDSLKVLTLCVGHFRLLDVCEQDVGLTDPSVRQSVGAA